MVIQLIEVSVCSLFDWKESEKWSILTRQLGNLGKSEEKTALMVLQVSAKLLLYSLEFVCAVVVHITHKSHLFFCIAIHGVVSMSYLLDDIICICAIIDSTCHNMFRVNQFPY